MLPKSARGWLLALLLVAAVGGITWEALAGGVSSAWKIAFGGKLSSPKPGETATGLEPVFKALALDAKEKDRREAVAKEFGKADPAKVAEALRKPAIDPYFLLGKADPDLKLFIPEKATLAAEKAQAVRAYLAEWRVQLAALRKASQEAGLHGVEGAKLDKLPTLYLLKELATSQPEYDDLPAAGGSDLPFFSAEDAKTAAALRRLFGDAEGAFQPGTLAFAKSRLGVGPEASLTDRLTKLAALAQPLDESFLGEAQAASMAKLLPEQEKDKIDLCSAAVGKLAAALRKGKKLDPAALPPR